VLIENKKVRKKSLFFLPALFIVICY